MTGEDRNNRFRRSTALNNLNSKPTHFKKRKMTGKISVLAHSTVNPYPDLLKFYSNIRDETACINKYPPVRKLSQMKTYRAL